MAWGKDESTTAAGRQTNIPQHGVVVTRAADLKPQKLARVWHRRFFLGKIGIIAGEPGLGKSQIAAYMAAMVSTGGAWPLDEGTSRRGDVIYISAEDGAADTIRPRLEAAGADLDRVHIIEGVNDELGRRPFNFVVDLDKLDEILRNVRKPRLVIVDPINACLSSTDVHRFNPNSVTQVRALLKAKGGSALSRVTGSFAFGAAARSVFTVERKHDDPNQRVFAPAKMNLAGDVAPLAFRIDERLTTSEILAPYAVFASR